MYIQFTFAISYSSFNMQNKNILMLYKLQNYDIYIFFLHID